jgi:glycerol-3-phosphate dehydrogenase
MKRFLENHKNETYDVIVVGGGISGAAVAYDAASRGLKVALFEKSDFGGATSSATSKMIHGGLRYLATGEIGLVRESLRERRTMENIAPNFVYPMPILFTANKSSLKNSKFILGIGMMLYDILSFDKKRTWDESKKIPAHRSLSAEEVMALEPNVRKSDLAGAVVYYDCVSICPERLTLAFIKSALKYGAVAANYAKVEGFVFNEQGRVGGVKVRDLVRNKLHEVRAGYVINCGGPWADIVLGYARKTTNGERLRRSEGIHLITRKLVNSHIVGSATKDGRHYFIIPWRGRSLIGTTDKEFIGNPDEYSVSRESILELLNEVNENFGNDGLLTFDDILFTYGGLRPLVEDQTRDVYESSRKYEIYDNTRDGLEGLITVEGGKYTTSRNLAEHVVDMIQGKMGRALKKPVTGSEFLAGCEIPDINQFILELKLRNHDFPESTIDYLGRIYGTEVNSVLGIARTGKSLADPLNDDGEMVAQVIYAIREEMALTLKDILLRRTGIGTLGNPGLKVLRKVANAAAKELGWSDARMKKEISEVKAMYELPRQ